MPRSKRRQETSFGRQNNPSQSSGNRGGFEETGSGYRYDDQRRRFGNQQYQGRFEGSNRGQEGWREPSEEAGYRRDYQQGRDYGQGRSYGPDYSREFGYGEGRGYEGSSGIGRSDWSQGYPESYRESWRGNWGQGGRDRDYWNREAETRYGREGSGYGSEEYGGGMEEDFGYDSPGYSDRGSRQDWSSRSFQGGGRGEQRGYQGGRSQGSFAGRGPQGYKRSDERITEDVNEGLTQDSQIDATYISVEVQNGEVTLKGTVPDRQAKRRAEDIAESSPGVKQVQNQLRIKREDESESESRRDKTEDKRSHRQQMAS